MSSSLPNQGTACCVGRRVNSPIHLLLGLCRKVVTMRVSLLQGFVVLCIAFHSSNISLASKRQGQHKEARLTLKPIHGGQLILSSGRIKLGEVYLSGINGLRGEKGEKGPKGDTGNQGAKGEKGDSCSTSCRKSVTTALRQTTSEPCNARLEGELRYDRTSGKLNICSRKQWHQLQTVLRGQINNSPPRKSCLEILFKGESQGDGMYWINPVVTDPERNAFRAYCDMTTAGGGWTLVAKVTHDYSWVCPDRDGGMCLGSKTDPLTANLFHDIHQRDSVDLSIKSDADAGVHLNDTIIRLLFVAGRQSVRFTFVGSGNDWTPSEDAYAAFNPSKKNSMFVDHEWGQYTLENVDYTWNIIQQSRKDKTFTGRIICWGNKVKHSYRFYDHGLHVGSPASAHKPCLLDNNQNEVMLKSHYATLQGSPLKARWDMAQFGFLGAQYVQVPNKRIAIWVR